MTIRKPAAQRTFAIVGIVSAFFGCSTTTTGVMQMGKDTYTVTHAVAPIEGGLTESKKRVYADANSTCAAQGKNVVVQNTSTSNNSRGRLTQFEMIFRCLSDSDSEYAIRPSYAPPPTTVIEDRRSR
jgi:hypothetical protein